MKSPLGGKASRMQSLAGNRLFVLHGARRSLGQSQGFWWEKQPLVTGTAPEWRRECKRG